MTTAFQTFSRANVDDADPKRPASDFVAGMNLHLESGQVFEATGNVLVPGLLPPSTGTTVGLGSLTDGATGTAIAFYFNSAGAHRLVRYNPLGNAGAGSEDVVLEWAGLNLSETLVLQGGIIGDLLVYLDAAGEIRCINLARATAGGYPGGYLTAEPFALHVVKVPPRQALLVDTIPVHSGVPGESLHIIQSRAYQFSYRYRYDDGETTVFAPFSAWLDVLIDPATALFDTIRLTVPPVPRGVVEIEILVRQPDTLTWQVADTMRRAGGIMPALYYFYGQVLGATLLDEEANRLYESLWPAQALAIARSRLFAALFLEGYPTPEPSFTATVTSYPTSVPAFGLTPLTFHENCPYRIIAQFYDAFGRPFGGSQPKTVGIPPQDSANLAWRRVQLNLTTTGATALNTEIPAQAYSLQFLFAPNDRTPRFIQGRVADVYAYFGAKIEPDDNNVAQESVNLGNILTQPHQQVAVNIGNFIAGGQGYVWQAGSGDIIRFLDENVEFQIVAQKGDYVICNWSGQPARGLDSQGNHTNVRIEIYSPNLAPLPSYYERGPVIPIVRTLVNGQEQRSYSTTSLEVLGDTFLVPFFFPVIDRGSGGNVYSPPARVQLKDDPNPIFIESMVPLYRLAPTRTTASKALTGALSAIATINQSSPDFLTDLNTLAGVGSRTTADLALRTTTNLRWLDMSLSGRPGLVVPKPLQQVRRNIERFSGQKQQGNLINGLSRWEALNQYDKLPQEQGDITALVLADQSQTDGSVLLALQQRGIVSQYLGQQPIQTDPTQQILSISTQVVGGDNTLKGGLGCTDPATIVSYAGKVFYFCRDRAELVRYHNGLIPLGQAYKFRFRLQKLTAMHAQSRITGCFDPRREEYLLTFHETDSTPAETVVWSEREQAWADQLSSIPTSGAYLNNELLVWQGSDLYRHTPTAPRGTFFGQYVPASVTFTAAQPAGEYAKTFQQIGVHSQAQWVPTALSTPSGQESKILPGWQKFIQGIWRSAIRRDQNSPGFGGSRTLALHNGRVLQAASLTVTLTAAGPTSAPLTGASVDFLINTGQQPNQ